MTTPIDNKSDDRRDTVNSAEAEDQLYDPWEARFNDEKRRTGTAE